ncbi:MAG TPA: carbohydrate-binding protein [Bacteroidales bacterium]|nr:carbohydrate-binding protein [Bacteroidales bacterium]
MKKLTFLLSIVILAAFAGSCTKDVKTYPVNVRLTDDDGPYDGVFIDLEKVELTGNDGVAVMMDVNTGIYNLLDFSNGVDTLIATGGLEVSRINQIRLVLGSDNTVTVNGVSYPLSTPSADQSGLKLQVQQDLQPGVTYTVLLDFDANKSIIKLGNGDYKLKPVIRTIETALSGAIMGKISPVGTAATIVATSGGLSYSTTVNATGNFLLAGLPPGTYSLLVTPEAPFAVMIVADVDVSVGQTTNIGMIIL